MLGSLWLLEVLEADRDELERRLVHAGGDGNGEATQEGLRLILADAVDDLSAGIVDVGAPSGVALRG